jgi:lanosterol synthase
MTDHSRWRLKVDHGAQTWHYLSPEEAEEWPPHASDQYWLGKFYGKKLKAPNDAYSSAVNGFKFFKELQTEDGHWSGEYGGPMFLIPGLAIVMYITGAVWPRGYEAELIRYLKARAHKSNGGWGM